MILVPTYVAPSTIHGLGLFAGRRIRPGEVVSVWDPQIDGSYPPAVVLALDEPERSLCLHFGYVDGQGVFRLAAGGERYINHSESPNLVGDPARFRIAWREIAEGEEMVEDYREHEPGSEFQ